MTIERVNLSIGSLERMDPVSPAPVVQGHSSPKEGQSKQRRRLPPADVASGEPDESLEQEQEKDQDEEQPQHRIDKLV
jgi:hypothetical protein